MSSVLFVCLANICRSPALEATLRHLAIAQGVGEKIRVDSCGLGWYHLGERPDARIFEAAKARGILIDHRAAEFDDRFFNEFDYIVAVDKEIAASLKSRANEAQKKKIYLATEFSKRYTKEAIPDPYYLSDQEFGNMMEMIIDCCEGWLAHLKGR